MGRSIHDRAEQLLQDVLGSLDRLRIPDVLLYRSVHPSIQVKAPDLPDLESIAALVDHHTSLQYVPGALLSFVEERGNIPESGREQSAARRQDVLADELAAP